MANYIVSDTNLTAVANAIRTKGGTSAPLEFPDDFVSAIGDIQTGGGTPAVPTGAVRFLDYDGTVVAAYSASEFASLTALPSQPIHSGLTGQGWTWKLADAKTYVQNNGKLDIGGYYVTDDGKTRLYIEIPQDTPSNRMTFYVRCSPTVAAGVTIDWGDGTTTTTDSTSSKNYEHTYEATGEYLITLTVSSGTLRLVGSSSQSIFGSTSVTHNRTRIKKVELGSNLHATSGIGTYAFSYCYSLQSVTIPNSVTSIGGNAFSYCYSLQSVTIPSGVTSIGGYAFYYCYSLQSVTIPNSVTSIGGYAFASCTGMGAYILKPETPPTLTNANTFSSIPSDCVIYVPTGKLTDYQTANIWSTWAAKMVEE